jgi:hypothetical protein
MMPMHIDGNSVKLRFNRDFYDMFPITEVCERFSGVAKIRLCFYREENIIEVTMEPKAEVALPELAQEFCNHCLHEQVMSSR